MNRQKNIIILFMVLLTVGSCHGQGNSSMKSKGILNECWTEVGNSENRMEWYKNGDYTFTGPPQEFTKWPYGVYPPSEGKGTYVYQPETNEIFVDLIGVDNTPVNKAPIPKFISKKYFSIIEENGDKITVHTIYLGYDFDWKIDAAGKRELIFLGEIDHIPFKTQTYIRSKKCDIPISETKNTPRMKEYPLYILEKTKSHALTLNSLYKEERYEKYPVLKKSFLNNGDFFLSYTISIFLDNGHEKRSSYTVHYIPIGNDLYKIESIKTASAEHENGKEIEHAHPSKKWIEWKDEGFSDKSSDAAKVLKYYLWRGKRYPGDIKSVMERLNSWANDKVGKDEIERLENEEAGIPSTDFYIVSGETRGFVHLNKEILKELGAEAIWNRDKKEYELKW